jgi:nucleoside-diphosphate-sugar epimerase
MKVLIVGAAGMIGGKLARSLLQDPPEGLERLRAVDVIPPRVSDAPGIEVGSGALDITDAAAVAACIAERPDVIFHLAAVVSGEAEADFEKGYAVNFDGTRAIFEAIRAEEDYVPRVVFASSIAVFGAPFPDPIPTEFHLTPLTSYGTQKAMGELLLADYSRRGFLDGIGLRLPTICVRPGAPNKAASGFFSSIMREPLAGREAVLPVDPGVRHWHASPRAAVGFLRHAMTLDTGPLGGRRSLTLPGVSVTVGEQIEALRRVAGARAVALIRREPDPTIARIVAGWPTRFDASRALELGFRADASFDAIIAAHVEDELDGQRQPKLARDPQATGSNQNKFEAG